MADAVKEDDYGAENVLWKKLARYKAIAERDGKENNEKDKEIELLKMSDISLILETYNDIFSSFDPRPYSQRALSVDFLDEMKRAVRSLPSGAVQLKLLIPTGKREFIKEQLIRRRLKEHFKKHYMLELQDIKKLRTKGIIMAIAGISIIFVATYFFSLETSGFLSQFIRILLEPAGWFTAWTGLEDVYYTGRELNKELSFYEKMSQCEVDFVSY